MRKSIGILFLCFLFLFTTGFIKKGAPDGGIYYTKVNIWYEKAVKILSTNYHKGQIIPVGSEVVVVSRGSRIVFTDKAGIQYQLILVPDYTALSNDQFLDRYFSKDNILSSPEYASFSAQEKTNIKNGTIEIGMSKAAVLVAYGYPPSHRTPSTESNVWKYWISRLLTDDVQFENGKVSNIVN